MLKTAVGIGTAALVAVASALAFSPRTPPPLAPNSVGAEKTHFNALTIAGKRLLAAGAMGEILYSDDQGAHWTPAKISQDRQALLNNMSFASDSKTGFAVGHENWILRTRDGGASWEELNFKPKNGEPLMSVARLPSGDWLSVGAFGKAITSKDEGKTWEPYALPAEVEDKHLNRIASSADGKHWLIVGERGLVLRSDDATATWHAEPAFYNGSFYNAMPLANNGWLIYGMRGNVYVKADSHAEWAKSSVPAPVAFFGHAREADGTIVLVGQGSMLGISEDNGKTFTLRRAKGRATLTDVVLLDEKNGKGWIASDAGLQPMPDLNAKQSTAAATQPSSQGTKP